MKTSLLKMVAVLACCTLSATIASADGTTVAYYDMNGDALADVGSIDGVAGSAVGFSNVDGRDAATFGTVLDDGTYNGVFGFTSAHVATSSFSISLWINATDTTGQPQGIFDLSGDGGDGPQMLFGNQAMPNLIARLDGVGSSNSVQNAMSGFDNGAWHFAALTYDGTTFSFFVDNSMIGSGAVTGPVTFDADQYLGAFNLNGNNANKGLAGAIDDFAIYDGVLSAQQLSNLASGANNPGDFAPIPEPSSLGIAIAVAVCSAIRRRKR